MKTLRPRVGRIDTGAARLPPKEVEPFYKSEAWLALVDEIKRERGSQCERCGRQGRVVGDHVQELKDGGPPLDKRNVKLMCWPCHTTKTNIERAKRHAVPLEG